MNHLELALPFHYYSEKFINLGLIKIFLREERSRSFNELENASKETVELIFSNGQKDLTALETSYSKEYATSIKKSKKDGLVCLTQEERISDIKEYIFQALYFLLSKKKLELFKAIVNHNNIVLSVYKNYTVDAIPTIGKKQNLPLLEVAALCLQTEEFISFLRYLHLEQSLEFDKSKNINKWISAISPEYKILFELEHALKESFKKHPKAKWEKPLDKFLESNNGCLQENGPTIQEYLNAYLEKNKDTYDNGFAQAVKELVDQQLSLETCSVTIRFSH